MCGPCLDHAHKTFVFQTGCPIISLPSFPHRSFHFGGIFSSFTFNGLIQPAFLMVRTIFMIGKTPVWVVKTFSPSFDVLTCLNPMFVLDDSTCNNWITEYSWCLFLRPHVVA
jgi:hypothetical protein